MASSPVARTRRRKTRAPRLALGLFALVATFAEPARALDLPEPAPARVTRPVDIAGLPTSLAVDDGTPIGPGPARGAYEYVVDDAHAAQEDLAGQPTHPGRGRGGGRAVDGNGRRSGRGRRDGGAAGSPHGRRWNSAGDDAEPSKTGGGDKTATGGSTPQETSPPPDHPPGRGDATTGLANDGSTQVLTQDLSTMTMTTDSLSAAPSTTTTATQADSSESPLPVPFDNTPTSDFSTRGGDDSCPRFINNLLSSKTFGDCYPLSMMVMSSNSFFEAKRQLTSMVRVLDATCAADVDSCSNFMSSSAQNLTSDANCKEEYDAGITVVTEAYNGLMNYRTMYSATCLENPETSQYCYAGAVTNTSSASDSYLYYLPYDLALPASATPSCSWCNQKTMDVFHAASANRNLLIADTYVDAARIFNNWCDPDFVNGTLADPADSPAPSLAPPSMALAATMFLIGVVYSFV